MHMSSRAIDFLSSFGVMIAGVAILAFGSVSFTHSKVDPVVAQFPLSKVSVIDETQAARVALFPVSRPAVPVIVGNPVIPNTFTAAAVLVVDDKTNTVLFKHNSTEVRPLASITKLMSALVLLDTEVRWASSTVIVENDIADDSYVTVGERYVFEDLWNTGLIGSSNSAIRALVRESGLSEDVFVGRMNAKAQELGLLSLRFVEPTGLDSRNMGTAQDVARLLTTALAHEKIKKTLAVGEYYVKPLVSKEKKRIWSTNWLLTKWIPHTFAADVVGKTGFINESGYNVAVRMLDKSNHLVRVVVLGAASNEFRFSEARDIAEWVFTHTRWPEDQSVTVSAE